MLGKMLNLGLRWKFGVMVFMMLAMVMSIPYYILKGSLNRKLDVLYGAPETKGLFVAELVANALNALNAQNVDSPEVQKAVQETVKNYYQAVSGMYNVRYIIVQVVQEDQEKKDFVLASSFPDVVPQVVMEQNAPGKEKQCKAWEAKDKRYADCAVPLNFAKDKPGAVRVGILDQPAQAPMLAQLKAEQSKGIARPVFFWSLFLVILVTAGATAAFWYFVLRRIASLSEATERMGFGDLETVVASSKSQDELVKSQDELDILENTLEQMRANLKDAIERLKRRK